MTNVKDNFELSQDEYRNFARCLGNEEFRALFMEYCEELNNPENRKQYEDEIKLLEAERGYNIRFVKPLPGYVIKTVSYGTKKVFINVCHCDSVNKPVSYPGNDENGQKGLQWSIPFALSQPRKDYDNRKQPCLVYDVVFNYDALHLANSNTNFRKLVTDTALDAVQNTFDSSLDVKNLKYPKMQYKGIPQMTVIREKKDCLATQKSNPTGGEEQESTVDANENFDPKNVTEDFIIPTYKLIQRKELEMHEVTEELDAKINITIPKELVVDIELPLLASVADCKLSATGKELHLINDKPGKRYKLEVQLPYEVTENNGSAKFNHDSKILTVVLPVIQKHEVSLQQINCRDRMESFTASSELTIDGSQHEKSIVKETVLDNMQQKQTDISKTLVQNNGCFNKAIFPRYSVNKMENTLAFTLNVKNVDPASIIIEKKSDRIWCYFTNTGSGYYTASYAFYVIFPNAIILDAQHEQWDNNIILQLFLDNPDIDLYYSGANENEIDQHSILEDISGKNNVNEKEFTDDSLCVAVSSKQIKEQRKTSNLSIEIKTRGEENDKCKKSLSATIVEDSFENLKNLEHPTNNPVCELPDLNENNSSAEKIDAQDSKKSKRNSRKKNKKRSNSESLCDKLKDNISENSKFDTNVNTKNQHKLIAEEQQQLALSNKNLTPRKGRSISESHAKEVAETNSVENLTALIQFNQKYNKGILKHSSFDRSVSECSSFEENSYTASVDGTSENNNLIELSESCRKTVRFNDFIKTKLFRSNSSILAQKKKNAKKNESKKRVMSRRASEGESTDNEEKDFANIDGVSTKVDQKVGQHDSGISLDSDAGCSDQQEDVFIKQEVVIDEGIPFIRSKSKLEGIGNKSKASSQTVTKFSDSSDIEFKSDMIFDIEM